MSSSEGFISCKGFAYNIYNTKLVITPETDANTPPEDRIKLGTIEGKLGAQIKIECLFGTTSSQGPIVLTIYGSFNNNTPDDTSYSYNNFEGYYTIIGKNINTNNLYIRVERIGRSIDDSIENPNFNYSVYFFPPYTGTNIRTAPDIDITLNYFVYLPNNCTWVNDGNSYNRYTKDEDAPVHDYSRII